MCGLRLRSFFMNLKSLPKSFQLYSEVDCSVAILIFSDALLLIFL